MKISDRALVEQGTLAELKWNLLSRELARLAVAGTRPDLTLLYILTRQLTWPFDIVKVTRAGFDDSRSAVQYGCAFVLARHVAVAARRPIESPSVLSLEGRGSDPVLSVAREWLNRQTPLSGMYSDPEAACVRILLRDALEDRRGTKPSEHVKKLLYDTIADLKRIDPAWIEGRPVDLSLMRRTPPLVPESFAGLRNSLASVIARLHTPLSYLFEADVELRPTLLQFDITGWLQLRWLRMTNDKQEWRSAEALLRNELDALKNAAYAARRVDPQIAGVLACMLFYQVPDDLKESYDAIADQLMWSVEAIGLHKDERFRREAMEHEHVATPPEEWETLGRAGLLRAVICAAYDENVSASSRERAFRTAVAKGWSAIAAKALENGAQPRSRSEFLDFANLLDQTLQAFPAAADLDKRSGWLEALRLATAPVIGELTTEDMLIVHETLAAGSLLALERLNDRSRRVFYSKWKGLSEPREFTRWARNVLNPHMVSVGPARISSAGVNKLVRSLSSRYNLPVRLVSCRRLLDGTWSVVGWCGDSSKGITASQAATFVWPAPDLARAVGEMTDPGDAAVSLNQLGGYIEPISRIADRFQTASLTFLSVDEPLRQLPWQKAIARYCPDTLTVIAPSLTWLSLANSADEREPDQSVWDVLWSGEPDLAADTSFQQMRARVQHSAPVPAAARERLLYVTAHGTALEDSSFITVRLNRHQPVTVEQWLGFAALGGAVLHSCRSGHESTEPLGDIGGLPGLLLSIGHPFVLAPVVPIETRVAKVLQDFLMDHHGTFLDAYRAAVCHLPEVAYYTIYGLPPRYLRPPRAVNLATATGTAPDGNGGTPPKNRPGRRFRSEVLQMSGSR